ncbi:7-cyano-7-deazaguanine synthase, partial [bacterium]|nr:7-cyano-7-deazaguanine synthase [bacterium]
MRSTTPFVWIAAALVLLAGFFPSTDAFAQFAFDGTTVQCIDNGGAPDTVDATNDSILVRLRYGGDERFIDVLELTLKPSLGSGIIPYTPDTVICVTSGGTFNGYRMTVDSIYPNMGLVGPHPDSAVIVGSVRLRLINICTTPGQALSFEAGARGVWNTGGSDKCGVATVVGYLPQNCVVCTEGCVLIQYQEICGFRDDGIVAIDDRIWLDSLETSNLLSAGVDTVRYFADFRHITGDPDDSLYPAAGLVNAARDTATVLEVNLENGILPCADTIWIARIRYHQTDPLLHDTTMRVFGCERAVDNVRPEFSLGMIDTIAVINGNYIENDTLAGCCDTLRIWMATDSNQLGGAWPFYGAVEGTEYTEACGGQLSPNFDVLYIGVWLGDLVSPSTDTSLYPHNSLERALLCPNDSLLWLSARWGIGPDPGSLNDRIYIDIPFCPEDWGYAIQACYLADIWPDRIYVWALDDAGNRSNRGYVDDETSFLTEGQDLCFDVVPPLMPLGQDIYHWAGYCVKRFSPYDSTAFAHYRDNLSPDSIVWYKGRVDTLYTDIFNDVYYIGFDVRNMPEDTAPLVRLDWLHPEGPLPMDPDLDTLRWGWRAGEVPTDSTRTAEFTWYGNFGTDSIAPMLDDVYSAISDFWKCNMGGGLTVGFTFARWMDAAGCNRILGSDYDGQTDIDNDYTTRNQLHALLDMCKPGTVTPGDTLKCTNLVLGSGPSYDLPGPAPVVTTYLWNGPNGVGDNPILRFRPQRNFAQNPFDFCMTEDTFFYRVRVDTVDLIGAIINWPGVNDSVRWYSGASPLNGTGNPYTLWTPITFNAGDINASVIEFTWGHKFGGGGTQYLPDGLYKLTLEVKDDAGNVHIDPIYIWLNGAGPVVDTLRVVNMDTVCTLHYYTGYTQDTVAVWVRSDTTADAMMIDWTCVFNVPASRDTTWATLIGNDGVHKTWFGYLIIDSSMVSPFAADNSYEVSPWEADCENSNLNRIINVRAFDFNGLDTLYTEPDPAHLCERAIIGISPCARLIGIDQYFHFTNPDQAQSLYFGHGVEADSAEEWGAISPGKIDSMGGAGTYNALTNWANDQIQDSIFLRLLIDSASIGPDTVDTLVLQFVNPTIYPPEAGPRIRELRKGLFVPTSTTMSPDYNILNTIFHGFLELDDLDQRFVEFKYFWNGTWFIGAGEDSIMLVPYNQQDTIIVRAYMIAGDSIISIVGNDTTWLTCDTIFIDSLDIDNINPDFRASTSGNNWSGWIEPGHHPVTGSTQTVQNLGYGSDCGFRFGDEERFRLRVKMTEWLHHNDAAYPNQLGSHNTTAGYWPTPNNQYRGAWQISPIDLRTGDVFAFGPSLGDSCVVFLDSVLVDTMSVDSVYYTLCGHFDFPDAAAEAWFIANGPVVDSVCLVIRSAWDQAGNPGRYNNPVFNDGLRWDSSEDTTFCVNLITSDPWAAGCPLVWGRPTTVHGWTSPDSLFGWIAAEEDSVIVWATIIETPEVAVCPGGTYADSAQVVEGNFQPITDDPNPWVLPNEVGGWFLYRDPITLDTLGWARKYKWYLRADSSDLAQIRCDGDYLKFWLHLLTYGGVNSEKEFDDCVQVDVNEPLWTSYYQVFDTNYVWVTACIPSDQPFWLYKTLSDDQIDCMTGDGVGVDTTTGNILADLSFLLGNAVMDSVPPDSLSLGGKGCWWYIDPVAAQFQCVDSALAWVKFYALTDSVGHYDRELFDIDSLYLCDDCEPPELRVAEAYCDCDSATYWYNMGLVAQRPLQYVHANGPISLYIFVRDVDGDSSSGMSASVANYQADLSSIDETLGWTNAQLAHIWPLIHTFGAAVWYGDGCNSGTLTLNHYYENGDTIFVDFRLCDAWGNCDTTWHWPVAIVDTLPPIVDYIYTIGDDSIRAYVTPGDEHVHVWADLVGYPQDMVSAPEHVWADFSNFWCDSLHKAWYDTVYAHYVDSIGPDHYRAYWGWYPPEFWTGYDLDSAFVITHPVFDDSLLPGCDTLATADTLCMCANLGAEGYYDSLWVYVTDPACNMGQHYSVFELSGCDSTTPAVDFVEIWGNGCSQGWISSTPLDSHKVEIWAWMDASFDSLADTLRIDSMQANLAGLSPMYAITGWTAGLGGGAPVYGYVPDSSLINGVLDTDGALLLPTYWDIEWDGAQNRLVAKWILLKADNLGCLDTVVVPVKAMRQTGLGGSHGYYIDVEYGWARVDTTRPVIYDMRVHSATTSINETTWVSPNVPLYVDVWAYDTNCDTITDHLGFDLVPPFGPFIAFCNPVGGFDTIWDWTPDAPDSISPVTIVNDTAWVFLRWIGTQKYDSICNAIDLDNITGCIEAHIEDCLSNPAVPVQKQVTTDDRPPEYVYSRPWGDFTHVTGFPGNPEHTGVDSVLVLQNSVYALDWDSVLVVNVVVDNFPGDTLISWNGTFINFAGFLNSPIQFPDEIFYNVNGNHRDSLVWIIPLYTVGFNTGILSDRYWYPLVLADTMTNNTGDPWDEQPDPSPTTLFCDDLDSAITFTIQNWNSPNPGMILLCDSTTRTRSDTDFVDMYNMALWNNEFISPDTVMENLYKIYYAPGQWRWYSHEDENQTRFFIFVEDSILQNDDIDNDHDGFVDEIGEGVDFYTADMRLNNWEGPQVGHVDSMNVGGAMINYLWFADNFDQQRYDVYLAISDIYGHRDTLTNLCEDDPFALQFYEDETCPIGDTLSFWKNGEVRQIRFNNDFLNSYYLPGLSADDSLFLSADFDSISLIAYDPAFALFGNPLGSGPDLDTTTVDSVNYNNGMASMIELLGPDGNPVLGFVQNYWPDTTIFSSGPLTLVDPTDVALSALPDGWYTIRATMLDRVGNSCVRTWSFRLDRTCPRIDEELTFVRRPGLNAPTVDLFTSWDYVEIVANVADSLDGVDSVYFEYCYDANRDGNLDAYPYWQVVNVLSDEGGAWDTEYPFIVYWNIRNLPWSSADTLGLPPVNPDTCMNRYFVRIRALDTYGHECSYYWPVDITDDIAPLAYIRHVDFDFTPQGHVVQCYNPNVNLGDSLIWVSAYDSVMGGYDPLPGDSFSVVGHWFDLAKGVFQYKVFDAPNVLTGDPYTGWTNMRTPNQDTATYRNWFTEAFHIEWNLIHPILREPLRSDQYNIRFVGIDVCGNSDALNTPVITVRMECDTSAPIAVICVPDYGTRVTNWRCDPDAIAMDTAGVFIKSVSAIWSDIDSVAFFFIDSLSVPGLPIHTFIGGDGNPYVMPGATEAYTRWNTNNLLSGWYTLYAVAYDSSGLFDTDPILHRLYVDNTMPTVELCYPSATSLWDGDYFTLTAFASDPGGGRISAVWFQYLNRYGNWVYLPDSGTDPGAWGMYGADVYAGSNPDYTANSAGAYTIQVRISDFDQSPLDSIRFRAIAVDRVDVGNYNWQGDYNRDCNVDRDLTCGVEVCCMAVEIRDQIPFGTNMWAYNHGNFAECCLPHIDSSPSIEHCDVFSTCNDQNPLDTLLLVATVHDSVRDGWLMHFKFRRAWPTADATAWDYVPNNTTINPWIPALGPIVLYHTWDSVYVIWTDVRAYIEAADAAAGLTYSVWQFAAQVEDLTGNMEPVMDQNMRQVRFACLPNAPITAASYVRNPDRERVEEPIIWNDFVSADTIEVLYNRTTGPGQHDPEALVLLYTDASSIMNCRNQVIQPFNIQLWQLAKWDTTWEQLDHDTVVHGDTLYAFVDSLMRIDSIMARVCPNYVVEPYGYFGLTPNKIMGGAYGFDQYPPDDGSRYVVGLYLDNLNFPPGIYNLAMVVRTNEVEFGCDTTSYCHSCDTMYFYEGDSNLDGELNTDDSTRIDIVIRVVNVNEPQITFCYPEYGATCVHGTVPMSASLVDNPEFTGVVDTVWFQYYDGMQWLPIVDPVTGRSYDTDPTTATVRMEFNENEVPGMAGWYYDRSGQNTDLSMFAWYAERDLFPDVWVWVMGRGYYEMTRGVTGLWTADIPYPYNVGQCTSYAFVIDANDNNVFEGPALDRWIADPRDACMHGTLNVQPYDWVPVSEVCACDYFINFPSRDFENTSYNFRTVVGWHDAIAYHVIENPSLGDSIHVFFVDNEPAEATHDIEFDVTRLAGGMLSPSDDICNPADTVRFVTDIQPLGTHGLVVEDICMVIYQVSLTSDPFDNDAWVNVDTVLSDDDMGWTEAWPSFWVAINPLADNVDNDGDGLVDETYDVMVGDSVGEENVKFWTRSVVRDYCGNTYYSAAESIWVDVSAPQARITQVGDVAPPDNQVVIVPADRKLMIIATDMSYADPGILGVFQYRRLGVLPADPSRLWRNIEAFDSLSNDTIRHIGNTYTAIWDLNLHQWRDSLAGYWDGSSQFLESVNNILNLNRNSPVKIDAPLIDMSKADIVREGIKYKVDFSKTWTCYEGG